VELATKQANGSSEGRAAKSTYGEKLSGLPVLGGVGEELYGGVVVVDVHCVHLQKHSLQTAQTPEQPIRQASSFQETREGID
jgi:hypothetical protein